MVWCGQMLELQSAVEEVFSWFPPKGFTPPLEATKVRAPLMYRLLRVASPCILHSSQA